jgi:hypothetical protein
MKTRHAVGICAAFVLLFTALVGCRDKRELLRGDCWPWVTVSMDRDTLFCPQGDSTTADGRAGAYSCNGDPVQGCRVALSLSPATLGILEYLNPELQDTTNDDGLVNFRFRSFGRTGNEVIQVFCGTSGAACTLYIAVVVVDTLTFCVH